jgi:hypothetical protein
MNYNIKTIFKLGSKLIFILLVSIVFVGCKHTLAQVEHKLGPPAKVEKLNGTTIYYYYYQKRKGTIVFEYTANSDGVIINAKKYLKQ